MILLVQRSGRKLVKTTKDPDVGVQQRRTDWRPPDLLLGTVTLLRLSYHTLSEDFPFCRAESLVVAKVHV